MEVTGEGSDHQEEGREAPPASVSSAAPPARGCSAASAGPAAVQPGTGKSSSFNQLVGCEKNFEKLTILLRLFRFPT